MRSWFGFVAQASTRITLRGRGRPAKWAGYPRLGLAVFGAVLFAESALGRPTRPRFEPTDLELEEPGIAELDLQFGVTRGDGDAGNRLVLPDFEFDLGLTSNVELDLDGAFAVERYDQPSRRIAGEALWPAAKLGLIDLRNQAGTRSFAVGAQLGPRIATVGDMRGVGYGALALIGVNDGPAHTVLNAGGFVDPGPEITRGQQKSVVVGLDVSLDLDRRSVWSLEAEFAVAHYLSPDPDELAVSFAPTVDPTPNLELSLTTIYGFLPGYDRIAVLFGVSPKVGVF